MAKRSDNRNRVEDRMSSGDSTRSHRFNSGVTRDLLTRLRNYEHKETHIINYY